jgi:ABC-2 type transport system permease protein
MLLCFIVVFGVILVSGIGINPIAMAYLPIFLIVEYILGLGIALISSALDVYFRDLEYILGVIAMAWTYLTPVMYSIDIVPDRLRSIFMLNPMTPIIVGCRDILYYKQIPEVSTLVHAFLMGIVFVIIGSIVFSKCEKHFAEEM